MTIFNNSILDRYHWWASLKHGGLLIAPAKLAEFFPEQAEPLPRYLADRLRRDVTRLQNGDDSHLGPLLDTVLEAVLALEQAWWLKGPAVENRWAQKAVTGELIKPRRVWQNPQGATLPVFTSDDARLGVGRGRRSVSRVIEWLRKSNLKIGLLTNGRQWRLIHAGADYDAWAEWDIEFWFEEGRPGPQLDALRLLLGQPALAAPETVDNSPLLAAIQASRQGQAELSGVLGERVRQAVELLIRQSAPNIETLTGDDSPVGIDNSPLYIAATRLMMRLVVILFAEARELLPIDNPRYHQSYGLQGLREQLDRRAGGHPERLRHSFNAWPRLLALFRLVYFGSDHADLAVPRYGGGLFAPGDLRADDPVQRVLTVFETVDPCPSDAAVYRLLGLLTRSKVKVRQGRGATWVEAPVDFSDLSSEYIGILYEGLLDFELRRAEADEPLLFLNLGDQPVLPLSRLEAMDDRALAALVEKFGKPEAPEEEAEDELEAEAEELGSEGAAEDEATDDTESPAAEEGWGEADDLTAQTHARAQAWAERAVVAGKLVAQPRSRSREAQAEYTQAVSRMAQRIIGRIILPGEWFLVRWGGTRKGSGTFYTRPQLAGPTVRRTLAQLLMVNDQLSMFNEEDQPIHHSQLAIHNSQFLRPPADILALKVCDPAMGSGSFLIAALRYLTGALYESLHLHGHIETHGDGALCRLPDGRASNSTLEETLPVPPDHPDFEERLRAILRRHVVERCLYGIDLNPLAVELARLALWVETMDRTLPFEFLDHKLKVGNALVGAWFDTFRDYPVMAWEREGGDKNHTRFVHHHRPDTDRKGRPKTDKQGRPKLKGDVWSAAIKEKKETGIKPEMIRWLQALAGQIDFSQTLGQTPDALQRRQQQTLGDIHATPAHEPERKAELYRQAVLGNAERQRLKLAFDTWCALWFWPGDRLDEAPLPRDFYNPGPAAREIIAELTARHRFFHWELEFPDVFGDQSSLRASAKQSPPEGSEIASGAARPRNDSSAPPYAGFDAIIGNPPWENAQVNPEEFFSNIDPLFRTWGRLEKQRWMEEKFEQEPQLEQDWLTYNAENKAFANWIKYSAQPFGDIENDGANFSFTRSGAQNQTLHKQWRRRRANFLSYADATHPFQLQMGRIFTYKLFLEQSLQLLKREGYLGQIVPSGIYTDAWSAPIREHFLDHCRWEWLFGFENREKIFDIDSRFKFCPIIVQKGGRTVAINAAFMQRSLGAWEEAEQYAIPYRAEQVTKFSPNSKAILELQTERDLEILNKLYNNGILLGDDSPDGWNIQYALEFMMNTDAKLFPPRPQWEADGYRPDEYGHWLKGDWQPAAGLAPAVGLIRSRNGESVIAVDDVEDVALPLYEGRMIGQFDFSEKGWVSGKGRTAVWRDIPWEEKTFEPQYLMGLKHSSTSDLKVGFMDVASSTNSRTMTATLIAGFPCGNKAPIFQLNYAEATPKLNLCAVLNSFVYDYQLRNRFGGLSLNYFIVEETALPKLNSMRNYLSRFTTQLTFAAPHFAREWLKLYPERPAVPWRQLWAVTPHERLRLRAILDAVVAHLYGLSAADFRWILRDCDHPVEQTRNNAFTRALDPKGFWRVDKEQPPELRHPVLAQVAFAQLQRLGLNAFLSQNNGEGWQLPESLRLADYGLGHDDRAREAQPVAAALGPRFLPWQLVQSVEESWAECARHAENLRLLLGNGEVEAAGESAEGETDLFGAPLQRDLFGNVVVPKSKGRKK